MITWLDAELEAQVQQLNKLAWQGRSLAEIQTDGYLNSETMLHPLTVAFLQAAFFHRDTVEAYPSESFPACPDWHFPQLWPLDGSLGY